ncbi:MAG: hypothetical protein PHQ42_02310 [Patescibacteria group bacterium]|nr:hypothetical protein [Patescibacteria group bacterium]
MKNKVIITFFLITLIIFGNGAFFASKSLAETNKEYRRGEMFSIGSRNYLAASNGVLAEILEITPADKLIKISEVYSQEGVNDLFVWQENGKTFLAVLTGQYLIKYDISNPLFPKIEAKRDLYQWRGKGKYKIGYMRSLAGAGQYLFTAGNGGVRVFDKNSLAVLDNKIFTLEPSYGLAAKSNILAVIIKDKGFYDKGLIFNIASGRLISEYKLSNKENVQRQPAIDDAGNVYFPSDNSLIKIGANRKVASEYHNPVKEGLNFSYAVKVLGDKIFYVNGFGLTKLGDNLIKEKFFFSAPSNVYGPDSWAAGVAMGRDGRVAIFNKSSVLLLGGELNLLDQYIYKPLSDEKVEMDLKIVLEKFWAFAGENLNIKISGFWPNEIVAVKLGDREQAVRVNNYGAAYLTVIALAKKGVALISATGQDSKLNYQTSFIIK